MMGKKIGENVSMSDLVLRLSAFLLSFNYYITKLTYYPLYTCTKYSCIIRYTHRLCRNPVILMVPSKHKRLREKVSPVLAGSRNRNSSLPPKMKYL